MTPGPMGMGPMGGPGGPPPGGMRHHGGPGGPMGDFKGPGRGPEIHPQLDLKDLEKQSEEMMTIHFLNRYNSVFEETEGGFLNLKHEEQLFERVQLVRTFPFTDKNSYISIRENTERAREIGIIRSLETDYDGETLALLEKHLNLRYFTPVITKIYSIKENNGHILFQVETKEGRQQFTVRNNSNSIIPFTETRIFITDVNNNRYEIPDTTKLNPKELTKLDLFI